MSENLVDKVNKLGKINRLRRLIKLVSDAHGGDDPVFLEKFTQEVIDAKHHTLDDALICFEKTLKLKYGTNYVY